MAAVEPVATATVVPGAPEGVPVQQPAPVVTKAEAERPPTQSALRAMPALLEKPVPAPQVAKALPVKPVAKASLPAGPPRRAKSLDDLIAQIMTSR
jgi:hypothetical protein